MARITQETAEGTEFSGKEKRASIERIWTFSGGGFALTGWPAKNTHTDFDFARSRGLRTAIASGTQFEGYTVQLMVDLFGLDWLSHGTMDVKFTGQVEVNDAVRARAKVRERKAEAGGARFVLDVWVENQRGDKVLVGSATGLVERVSKVQTKKDGN